VKEMTIAFPVVFITELQLLLNLAKLHIANLAGISYISTYQIIPVNLNARGIMKKINRLIEIAELDAVAHLNDDLALFIYCEDDDIPTSLCVQADFDTQQFGPVQPLAAYLESNFYEPIQDNDSRISYRKRIKEEMSPVVIAAMLSEFTRKRLPDKESSSFLSDNYPDWQPGG
jgi:hypothetical protein